MPSSKNSKSEIQQSKSPAEFFAENQAIAGFDNPGKSLYTTIRELVENSLDACESVDVLPDISVKIEEMTERMFNALRGVPDDDAGNGNSNEKDASAESKGDGSGKKKRSNKFDAYFQITVRDNGCGMAHRAIPDLLGRVLSGSKYGVRQTRGKFGLGAKMALIWSKKSTGVPIRVKTSHVTGGILDEHGERRIGDKISECVLDIDIYKNQPRIISHTQTNNNSSYIGTEIQVLISGNWTTYKSRVVQYLQQLAIITPYAKLEMSYSNRSDAKKEMNLRFDRRSEQMPPQAREVKYHPSSVNNLLIQQLLERTKAKTLSKFLTNDLSGITAANAKKLLVRLGDAYDESTNPSDLSDKVVTRLTQLLRSADDLFKNPDGGCLSPLGEYNLNLGIQKVVEPDIIATARDKPGAYDGHPFIVEAAVSLGGKDAKEGITVVRFANRIPLLFEGGADVATRVANSKIKWSSYKIDHKRDKIGVFVSIVSTKVPFKGTGKEYIGDDITEIQHSVKRAIQNCCSQLRVHLAKRNALRDVKERKSRLLKYVPDVSRSLFGILEQMNKRRLDEEAGLGRVASPRKQNPEGVSPAKRLKSNDEHILSIMDSVVSGDITEDIIKQHLTEAVEENIYAGLDDDDVNGTGGGKSTKNKKAAENDDNRQPLYLVPVYDSPKDAQNVICHPLFDFYPL